MVGFNMHLPELNNKTSDHNEEEGEDITRFQSYGTCCKKC